MSNDPENAPIDGASDLDSLEDRIAAARKAEDVRLAREHAPIDQARATGMQVVSTMVGYPLGGILVGLLLDNLFGTLPWITIVLMFLAFFGACIHVMRTIKNPAE